MATSPSSVHHSQLANGSRQQPAGQGCDSALPIEPHDRISAIAKSDSGHQTKARRRPPSKQFKPRQLSLPIRNSQSRRRELVKLPDHGWPKHERAALDAQIARHKSAGNPAPTTDPRDIRFHNPWVSTGPERSCCWWFARAAEWPPHYNRAQLQPQIKKECTRALRAGRRMVRKAARTK